MTTELAKSAIIIEARNGSASGMNVSSRILSRPSNGPSCNQFSEGLGIPSTEPSVHHNRFIVIHGRLFAVTKGMMKESSKIGTLGHFVFYTISPLSNCWRLNLSRQLFRIWLRKERNGTKNFWNKFRFLVGEKEQTTTTKNNLMNYTFLIRLQKK